MLPCPVALLADAINWTIRAGTLLMLRLTSAVALAATAFCLAILVAEQADSFRDAVAAEDTILSEVIARTVMADTGGNSCCR